MAQNPSSGAGSEQDCRPPRMAEGRWLARWVRPHALEKNERRLPTNQRSRMQNVVRLGAFHSWGTPLHPAEPGPPSDLHCCGQGRLPRQGGFHCETFRFGNHVCGRLARSGDFGAFPSSHEHGSHPTVAILVFLVVATPRGRPTTLLGHGNGKASGKWQWQ